MIRRLSADPGLLLSRSLCHELRPPMATLTGLLDALQKEPAARRRSELTRLAAEHVAYAAAILDQAASTVSELRACPITAVPLGDLLPAVAMTVPSGSLTLSASHAALHWPVHPRHTRQILINLVSNAVRHAPGPARLRARIRARRLRVAVEDQGGPTAGLHTALRRRTPPPDDRGLGLWLVRQLVSELGGTIHARPVVHTGLSVEAVLPRYRTG